RQDFLHGRNSATDSILVAVFLLNFHQLSFSDGARGRSLPVFLYSACSQPGERLMSDAPRIPLLDRDAASPDAQKIYDALLATRGVVPNMFKVLGYRPEIAQGVAGFLKPLLA